MSNTPKVRFVGFTGDWEQRKLGDFGSVAMCRRVFKHQTYESGEIPFFKIGTFGSVPDAFISKELFEDYKSKYPYPNKGDILISASGSIGRTVEFTGRNEYFQDSNIVWLKHDRTVINPFLRHTYSVVKWAGIEGSTIKRLYNDNILKTEIMLPSLQEQAKIAKILDSIDNLIALHQREYEKLVSLKSACLDKMFPKNGNKVPELRFDGFTADWEQCKVGDLLQTIPFKTYLKEPEQDGKYEIIQQGYDPIIGYANGTPCDDYKDTVIFGDHTLSLYKPQKPFFVATDGVRIVKGIDDMKGYYLLPLLERYKPQLEGYKRYFSILADRDAFFTANHEEQTQVGSFFANLDDLITLHQRKLEKLKQLKKSMLYSMFV